MKRISNIYYGIKLAQWESDFYLGDTYKYYLFNEYRDLREYLAIFFTYTVHLQDLYYFSSDPIRLHHLLRMRFTASAVVRLNTKYIRS